MNRGIFTGKVGDNRTWSDLGAVVLIDCLASLRTNNLWSAIANLRQVLVIVAPDEHCYRFRDLADLRAMARVAE